MLMSRRESKVTVKRVELLVILKDNRKAHMTDHKNALDGYRKQMLKEGKGILEKVKKQLAVIESDEPMKAGTFIAGMSFDPPECHENDFDQAIAMIDMSVSDDIELDDGAFKQLVMNDWDWQGSFLDQWAEYNDESSSSSSSSPSSSSGISATEELMHKRRRQFLESSE